MGWTELLPGAKTPLNRQGRDAFVAHDLHDYSGPADGDYARYVEQLMASADAQRRAQADVPVPLRDARDTRDAREAPGRPRMPAPGVAPTLRPASAASARSQAAKRQKPAPVPAWRKLFPFALWLLVVATMVFWDGAAPWLIGLLIVGAVLFNGARKKLGGKKP